MAAHRRTDQPPVSFAKTRKSRIRLRPDTTRDNTDSEEDAIVGKCVQYYAELLRSVCERRDIECSPEHVGTLSLEEKKRRLDELTAMFEGNPCHVKHFLRGSTDGGDGGGGSDDGDSDDDGDGDGDGDEDGDVEIGTVIPAAPEIVVVQLSDEALSELNEDTRKKVPAEQRKRKRKLFRIEAFREARNLFNFWHIVHHPGTPWTVMLDENGKEVLLVLRDGVPHVPYFQRNGTFFRNLAHKQVWWPDGGIAGDERNEWIPWKQPKKKIRFKTECQQVHHMLVRHKMPCIEVHGTCPRRIWWFSYRYQCLECESNAYTQNAYNGCCMYCGANPQRLKMFLERGKITKDTAGEADDDASNRPRMIERADWSVDQTLPRTGRPDNPPCYHGDPRIVHKTARDPITGVTMLLEKELEPLPLSSKRKRICGE